MQLGLAAGILDIDYLLSGMTSVQLSEWQAFYQIYPFGPQAETNRFATQQAHILNSPHYTTKKPRDPNEFLPCFRVKEQTPEDQIAMLKGAGF